MQLRKDSYEIFGRKGKPSSRTSNYENKEKIVKLFEDACIFSMVTNPTSTAAPNTATNTTTPFTAAPITPCPTNTTPLTTVHIQITAPMGQMSRDTSTTTNTDHEITIANTTAASAFTKPAASTAASAKAPAAPAAPAYGSIVRNMTENICGEIW